MKINPKQMEKLAKRMGIQTHAIEAEEVVIKTGKIEIVIKEPQVSKVNLMGQETYQIIGEASERPVEGFSESDVDMVAEKAGVSKKEAYVVLKSTDGDIAKAIMKIKEQQ